MEKTQKNTLSWNKRVKSISEIDRHGSLLIEWRDNNSYRRTQHFETKVFWNKFWNGDFRPEKHVNSARIRSIDRSSRDEQFRACCETNGEKRRDGNVHRIRDIRFTVSEEREKTWRRAGLRWRGGWRGRGASSWRRVTEARRDGWLPGFSETGRSCSCSCSHGGSGHRRTANETGERVPAERDQYSVHECTLLGARVPVCFVPWPCSSRRARELLASFGPLHSTCKLLISLLSIRC